MRLDPELAKAHQDALGALEAAARDAAGAALRAHLAKVGQKATTDWVRAFGDLDVAADDPAALRRLTAALSALVKAAPTGGLHAQASSALDAAVQLGHDHAIETLGLPVAVGVLAASPSLVAAAAALSGKVSSRLSDGVAALEDLPEAAAFDDVVGALGTASDSLNVIDRGMSQMTSSGAADGVSQVAEAAGVGQVWVAENDACVDCTELSGTTVEAGEDFPHPPGEVHPHCRCTTEPWDAETMSPPDGSESFPDALQREADRSIAKGWSVPSEHEAVRLRAADKLLKSHPNMPKSVIAESEKAVKKGAFKNMVPPNKRSTLSPSPTRVATPKPTPTPTRPVATASTKDALAKAQPKLNSEDAQRVRYYTGDGFSNLNNRIRTGTTDAADLKGAAALDKIIGRSTAPTDLTVMRGVREAPPGLKVGSTFTEKGFTSTTTDAAQAKGYAGATDPGRAIYRIKVPAGTPALSTKGLSDNAIESEVLLGSGKTYRVVGETTVKGAFGIPTRLLDLEVVPPVRRR